ncbi:helix-turn-helix domain-containing protein [Sutcliffiella sp. NC1]|uniref:helix-turn-helix domain-containing protein n=1 Tax=Sutcliffiella sp. NC1 TaxID=3004096 RepID=UPI0022DD8212|nr:helix-turn-helix domain-containing protein [Sutcliffiella sp. NC1]WBL14465.1 helix-turn-helix domain-containing protein [Sutcliffiella sp. NC1]
MKMMKDKLSRLFEINRSLTQSFDLEEILSNLVREAFDLIEAADTTILYKLREDGLLHFSHGIGVDVNYLKNVKFKPGESLTGHVFVTKEGVIANGDEIRAFMSNMTPQNHSLFFEGVFRREVKSGIVIPLIYKEGCIGILVVDNFETNEQFTMEEFEILEIVADQAAIAIMNSKLYEEVNLRNEELKYSLHIHQKFTNILLEGKGASYILKTISKILGTPVSYIEASDSPDFSFPIIISNELFGYFQLEKQLEKLNNVEKTALEHAATALSLDFLRQNTLFEKEMHLREEKFHDILNGTRLNIDFFKKYNLNETSKLSCMIIDSKTGFLWDVKSILQKEKLIRALERKLYKYSSSFFTFTKSDQIVVLLENKRNKNSQHLAEDISSIIKKTKNIAIGIGREVTLKTIGESFQEASEAVSICKKLNDRIFVTYSQLGVERLLLNTDRSLLKKFVLDKVGVLLQMEPEYLSTMQTYIANNKSHKKTAEELFIHPNTLAYRLKKIESDLNIDLNQKEDWINIVLALQMLQFI